jgi:glycerol-3-phosphate dehydrogenase
VTSENVWEKFPTEARFTLAAASPESLGASPASLFRDQGLPPHKKRILSLLKGFESTHIDTMIERLKAGMSSSEIFAAVFGPEVTGIVRQIPAENFVKSF